MLDHIPADPAMLEAATRLFLQKGYYAIELAEIASEAGVALPALQSHFPDKASLFKALLDQHNPGEAIQKAFRSIRSDNAEDMIREAIANLVSVFDAHPRFVPLAAIDIQVNNGAYIHRMFGNVAGESASFINRLSAMPDVRPLSSIMLARTFASLLIGYIATQHLAPDSTQFALRSYPQRAWIEGMTDIFLNGILQKT